MQRKITKGIALGNPKKKYRVLIRELKAPKSKKEAMTSFMIYDYNGRTTINSVKNRLMKLE